MPTYLYACTACGHKQDGVRRVDERDDCPHCERCFGNTERRITATMVSVFTPYTTACFDKETGKPMRIKSAAEHRAFLARNGLEEVGNDKSLAPKPPEQIAHLRREKLKELAADGIAPTYNLNEESHEATL